MSNVQRLVSLFEAKLAEQASTNGGLEQLGNARGLPRRQIQEKDVSHDMMNCITAEEETNEPGKTDTSKFGPSKAELVMDSSRRTQITGLGEAEKNKLKFGKETNETDTIKIDTAGTATDRTKTNKTVAGQKETEIAGPEKAVTDEKVVDKAEQDEKQHSLSGNACVESTDQTFGFQELLQQRKDSPRAMGAQDKTTAARKRRRSPSPSELYDQPITKRSRTNNGLLVRQIGCSQQSTALHHKSTTSAQLTRQKKRLRSS